MDKQALARMRELIPLIREADTAYYTHDRPIMTDREYDALYDELKMLEDTSGIVISGSPTQRTPGEVLEGLKEVAHTKPMLSAQKTKQVEDVIRFVSGRPAILSWKLDGLTIVLRYRDGKLTQAITRGREGRVGEDVTHTVKAMMNVPLAIPYTEPFEVRGEGVVSWDNFRALNQELEEPYTHPRGLAAGSVRKLDAGEAKKRYLEFIAFDMVTDDTAYPMKHERLALLADCGFDVAHHIILGEDASEAHIRACIGSFDPDGCAYPVDGVIAEYDDVAYGESLGATGHHENRLLALKWQDELYETTFLGVELATTRTGMVSITGKFADVEMDGATVNRAYLHNLDIFEQFQLGVGDRVQLYKANKIIPQLAENLTRSGAYRLPDKCPCCGTKLSVKPTTGGTRFLHCDNPDCPAKLVQKFVHFCEKTRMNIEGLSEATLEKFIEKGWIRDFGDIYMLERFHDEIVETEGFGEKSFLRLMASIEKSRSCTLNQFIAGCGIHTVGRTAGRILSRHFGGDWHAFEQAIKDGFDFTTLPDFGQTMHDNIYAWYNDARAERLWRPALQHLNFRKEVNNMANANNPFFGKTVVATGKLVNYTRDGIQTKLLSLGAKPASSVSRNTDYLIVGEKAGSKLEKAKQYGVTTLTEAQFEAMLA